MKKYNKRSKINYQLKDLKEYDNILLVSNITVNAIINNPFKYGTAQHYVYMLRCIIAEHNRMYYMWDINVISDFEYDNLLKKLRSYEAKFPQTYHELSPSNVVGSSCLEWPPPGTYRRNVI